jgi:predicted phosphoribosyltransferase
MFEDRTDAGAQLADLLVDSEVVADVVLAIPRGGLPVGRAVADALDAPLDIVAARKIGAPGNPELAIGAVAADGTVWLNDEYVERFGADQEYLDSAIDREQAAAREKVDRYRGDREPPAIADATVVIADDGVATGATTIACIRQVRNAGAARIVLAVPVGPPDTIERLHAEADEVLCVEAPPHFGAVGQFYESFAQVSDEEAMTYLE